MTMRSDACGPTPRGTLLSASTVDLIQSGDWNTLDYLKPTPDSTQLKNRILHRRQSLPANPSLYKSQASAADYSGGTSNIKATRMHFVDALNQMLISLLTGLLYSAVLVLILYVVNELESQRIEKASLDMSSDVSLRATQAATLRMTSAQKHLTQQLLAEDRGDSRSTFPTITQPMADYPEKVEQSAMQKLAEGQYTLEDLVSQTRQSHPSLHKTAVIKLAQSEAAKTRPSTRWAFAAIRDLEVEFVTDHKEGLAQGQVRTNQEKHGRNVIYERRPTPWLRYFLGEFASPLVILLIIGMVVSFIFQEWIEASAIVFLITINAVSSAFMQRKAAESVQSLSLLEKKDCEVIREGLVQPIPAAELVVGDLVILRSGQSVPADIRLTEVSELTMDEGILTGESEEVLKISEDLLKQETTLPANECFSSTLVTGGMGRGIVFAVGMETQIGLIAETLAEESAAGKAKRKTPLEVALNKLGGIIGCLVIALLLVISIVAWLTKYTDPSKPNRSRIITLAVANAVSAMPESLPTVVTLCFAMGSRTLNSKQAKVRHLPKVETLGSTSVICTDKTRTLTRGKLVAQKLSMSFYNSDTNKIDSRIFSVSEDIGTKEKSFLLRAGILIARLASPYCILQYDKHTSKWMASGNSLDEALVLASVNYGLHEVPGYLEHQKTYDVPFSSFRKMQIALYRLKESSHEDMGMLGLSKSVAAVAVIKGGPELVASFAEQLWVMDSQAGAIKRLEALQQHQQRDVLEPNEQMASEAYRVVALAITPLTEAQYGELAALFTADARLEFIRTQQTIWCGVIGCADPPKEGVREAIAQCQSAHIRIIVITGDQVKTTIALSEQIGLRGEASTCEGLDTRLVSLEGSELLNKRVDDITNRVSIFCRAKPEDKMTIVLSLQRQGHVVAMTGDGVNDAAALRSADIGVAMGVSGTDVAKGAAGLVLLDDNFATIVTAIKEGRRIFANTRKFVTYLIATDLCEITYLTISLVSGLKLPLNPVQVLYVNLLCDAPPAISLAKEPAESNVMEKFPRKKDEPIMTKIQWIYGVLLHLVVTVSVIIASTILFTFLSTGECWRRLRVKEGSMAGVITSKAVEQQCKFSDKSSAYFCQSSKLMLSRSYSGWVTSIDFCDNSEMVQAWGVITGRHTDTWLKPEQIFEKLTCTSRDAMGWCNNPPVQAKNDTVNVIGSRMASTQSFILASLAEILWPYCVILLPRLSGWLHVGASIPATLTLLVCIIPYVNDAMGLYPIEYWEYCLTIFLSFTIILLDELISKPLYRRLHGF